MLEFISTEVIGNLKPLKLAVIAVHCAAKLATSRIHCASQIALLVPQPPTVAPSPQSLASHSRATTNKQLKDFTENPKTKTVGETHTRTANHTSTATECHQRNNKIVRTTTNLCLGKSWSVSTAAIFTHRDKIHLQVPFERIRTLVLWNLHPTQH